VKTFTTRLFLLSAALTFFAAAANTRSETLAAKMPGFNHWGSDTYAELDKAPEKAKNRPNPFENDPQASAAGKILFEDHCAECHGDDADGARKGPSLRVSEVRAATPGTLFWVLTNGVVRKKMPAWSKLPEPQRWQLVKYIKSLDQTKRK
jgi:mono/diheme cytochrome c family protein